MLYSSTQSIQVEHQGVAQRLTWLQKTFPLSEADVVLQTTPLEQDTAVWEIFWPLTVGSRLVLAILQNKPTDLSGLITIHQISLLHLVPTALSELVESLNTDPTPTQLDSLRWVFCSGGSLRQTVVDAFFQSKSIAQCSLQYFYTLAEAAGEITSQQCQPGESRKWVPLGLPTYRPIDVLDTQLQPVPWGAKGEIYVGGSSGFARKKRPIQSELCPISSILV